MMQVFKGMQIGTFNSFMPQLYAVVSHNSVKSVYEIYEVLKLRKIFIVAQQQ